jgi:hypothetical protein
MRRLCLRPWPSSRWMSWRRCLALRWIHDFHFLMHIVYIYIHIYYI